MMTRRRGIIAPARGQSIEFDRLQEPGWRTWGPYLSERQWGTVREDYSANGDFWSYFGFDQSHTRAYRWGEDGLAGISDEEQHLCLALALWNGKDPILKERLFGLSNGEGNHGEDVKECYYYLDAVPSHAYLKMLYKYPQCPFPYDQLKAENKNRTKEQSEFELAETGCFDDDKYFDVVVEYARTSPDDITMQVTVHNRGPDTTELAVLPQLWFRNTWAWGSPQERPCLSGSDENHVVVMHPTLGEWHFYCASPGTLLFCENETHPLRVHGLEPAGGYFKDAFHEYVVEGNPGAVNPQHRGTKCAALYPLEVPPRSTSVIQCRLTRTPQADPFGGAADLFDLRRGEADAFYAHVNVNLPTDDARAVQRQALAGMIWNKQFYNFGVWEWLTGDPGHPSPPDRRLKGRNAQWQHLENSDVISMPDKWEFPWYAAWDLAFHCITFALIDPKFAKDQLILLTRERYMHPNGQLPAYEGNFSDVNPPVHAWATWHVYKLDRQFHGGKGDIGFLERVFHKLLLNFTWWVNRKDEDGLNVFQGGFLGLDNIGVFDRSNPLPTGGQIVQADATSWMATYALDLMRIALELARHNPAYEDIAAKFFQHYLHIAKAMHDIGGSGAGLWDETDQFYYDIINPPDGKPIPLKARSVVGLIPIFSVEVLLGDTLEVLPDFRKAMLAFYKRRPDLESLVGQHVDTSGRGNRLLSLMSVDQLKAVFRYLFDESEFLSPFGIRALSRTHLEHPYCFRHNGDELCVDYQPGESNIDHFGGNSNWRGPIWPQMNFLVINSLREYYDFYGDAFTCEFPTGSGCRMNLRQIADELSKRVCRIFLRGSDGRRPVFGESELLQTDPNFRDHLLFHEFFHGDTGRGCGASHQTGWTGLVANLMSHFDGANQERS